MPTEHFSGHITDLVLRGVEPVRPVAFPVGGRGAAGDGGAVAWPLLTSLLKAKEFVLTGDRIPAQDAERLGLANRVVPRELVRKEAVALASRLAALPQQAVVSTKRALNLHLERAMVGVMDFALAAESESFTTAEHRSHLDKWRDRSRSTSQPSS